MKINDKRGAQLAISTIILLIIGIIVLIGIVSILVMGWDDFSTAVGAAFGSETLKQKRKCTVACAAENPVSYCEKVTVDGKEMDCTNDDVKPDGCPSTCPTTF